MCAIVHANGNLTQAANLLGISHRTLWEKRKKYGLI
ncbi:MAG: helix-turn-helix domain-containing protein [Prevotella sp.]|nr:helix-turn-helix domain-containing protein [Prevotella sp.]